MTRKLALALVVAKIAWAVVLMQVGDYDFHHAHGDDVIRVGATFIGIPVHLVLAIFVWRGKKWATYALLVIALAGALGAGGTGLLFGLPHALDGNYTRDSDMIPYVSIAIVINVALAISLWSSRRFNRDTT